MLAIKPHHFVDIITALGEGQTQYPPHPYGHALHTVAAAVLASPAVRLRIELGADDICRPCRHNADGLCDDTIDTSYRPQAPTSKREWNLRLDQRWCERLGLVPDDTLTARDLCLLIRERAGDITAIYREIPGERTARRQANLAKGVRAYLDDARSSLPEAPPSPSR